MKFVIDSNVIFSSLMSGKTFYMDFLSQNEVYAPDFLFEEISEYENMIIEKTPLKKDFYYYAQEIFKYLKIIPKIAIRPETWQKAYNLCKEIDEKDTPFLALSLELNLPLITRDKKLYKNLIGKGVKNIILFEDLFERLQNQ
ncbi:MAG: PIN domain-containing protein [Candidatus Aminicenantes bacterium]|jgi:predicted nucleic acid-binding protein